MASNMKHFADVFGVLAEACEAAKSLPTVEQLVAEARRQALEEAAKACEAERLCEPQDDSDAAYDNAIDHCVQAIRALAPDPLLDRQGDGKEG